MQTVCWHASGNPAGRVGPWHMRPIGAYEFNVITENRRGVVLALVDLSAHIHSAEFLLDRLEMVLNKASTTFNIAAKIVAILSRIIPK